MHPRRAHRATDAETLHQILGVVRLLGTNADTQQNYNLLYSLYSEKITEVETLKMEVAHLRTQPPATNPAEMQMFK